MDNLISIPQTKLCNDPSQALSKSLAKPWQRLQTCRLIKFSWPLIRVLAIILSETLVHKTSVAPPPLGCKKWLVLFGLSTFLLALSGHPWLALWLKPYSKTILGLTNPITFFQERQVFPRPFSLIRLTGEGLIRCFPCLSCFPRPPWATLTICVSMYSDHIRYMMCSEEPCAAFPAPQPTSPPHRPTPPPSSTQPKTADDFFK